MSHIIVTSLNRITESERVRLKRVTQSRRRGKTRKTRKTFLLQMEAEFKLLSLGALDHHKKAVPKFRTKCRG